MTIESAATMAGKFTTDINCYACAQQFAPNLYCCVMLGFGIAFSSGLGLEFVSAAIYVTRIFVAAKQCYYGLFV